MISTGHQPRLYALTRSIGEGLQYDDDVVFAAAWLHDLGVFVGHRPEDPIELAKWDHVRYTCEETPKILEDAQFPAEKVPAVLAAIREHQPHDNPTSIEATILRDADILEQLGAIGTLRAVAKVGRDTRYATFTDVVKTLRKSLDTLPAGFGWKVQSAWRNRGSLHSRIFSKQLNPSPQALCSS